MTDPFIFLAILIVAVHSYDGWKWWRKRRSERPIPLTHPSARHFTQGLIPTHGAPPVTPREQREFDRITAALTPQETERNSKR